MQRRGGYLKMFLEKEGVDNSTRAAETLALAWGPAARLSAETRHGWGQKEKIQDPVRAVNKACSSNFPTPPSTQPDLTPLPGTQGGLQFACLPLCLGSATDLVPIF